MRAVGIEGYFQPIIVSGDCGYRKLDIRIFQAVLDGLDVLPENFLCVGNDMYRDIYGASRAGMKTVFFSSNQGGKKANGVEADYVIYQFAELRQAIALFEGRKREGEGAKPVPPRSPKGHTMRMEEGTSVGPWSARK